MLTSTNQATDTLRRLLMFIYGVACYGLFLFVFLYLIAFIADVFVSKTVNSGRVDGLFDAVLIDLGLIASFGLQHSIMARSGFKKWWTLIIPRPVERSTYVLATNTVLIVLMVFWQPLLGIIWQVTSPLAITAMYLLSAAGWLLVLVSTFLTDHFDLFGLRQVYLQLLRRRYTSVPFREVSLYRWIRHPMMLGVLIATWATPTMTIGHFLLSSGLTFYILVGIHFEEAGLATKLGEPYREYMGRTNRLFPFY